jgi:CBS domain-containing protein/sporulation protein YlmC with PRC-barrel domain
MISQIQHFLFLSDLLGKKVYKTQGNSAFGKIVEVIITPKEIYPEVTKLVISPGWFRTNIIINWDNIMPFDLPINRLIVKDGTSSQPFALSGNEMALKDSFMDKQILDVSGCKVVRINDLHLLKENNKIWVVHVDVGFRAILRRLEWEKRIDSVSNWIFSAKLPDQFVSWKHVQQLPSGADHIGLAPLKLKIASQPLTTLHPADLAEIIMDLDRYERVAFFRTLDIKNAAEVVSELKIDVQKKMFEGIDKEKRSELLSHMAPDKAADLLGHLNPKRREDILKRLLPDKAKNITSLLLHPEETAGSIMTTQFVALPKTFTVEQTLAKLKELAATVQALYYIYVLDENQSLLGVVTIRRLMAAQAAASLGEIMNTKIVKVKSNTEEKKITHTFIKYNFGAIPVVDAQNKLLGIIMFKDAVDKVLSAILEKDK